MSIIVKCLSCGTKNRVKENIPSKNATCGKCNEILPIPKSHQPINLSDANFKSFISNSKKPVLVDFWAKWCEPCKLIAPILEEFATLHPSITAAKVDVEANQLTPAHLQISVIPMLILFINKKEVKRISGAISLQSLESQLKQWLSAN